MISFNFYVNCEILYLDLVRWAFILGKTMLSIRFQIGLIYYDLYYSQLFIYLYYRRLKLDCFSLSLIEIDFFFGCL